VTIVPRNKPAPAAMPIAATIHSDEAVVTPRTVTPWRMIAPAPRNPMPETICAANPRRVGLRSDDRAQDHGREQPDDEIDVVDPDDAGGSHHCRVAGGAGGEIGATVGYAK
jgi:hypothetical protein